MPKRSDNPNIKSISSRFYAITPADDGKILDLGPGSPSGSVGTFTLQFNPDVAFQGEVVVMGVVAGAASDSANVPFLPIPYRLVTLDNVAQAEYPWSVDPVSGASIIQVPSNMLAIGLLVACSAGSCALVSWDLAGPSAV